MKRANLGAIVYFASAVALLIYGGVSLALASPH